MAQRTVHRDHTLHPRRNVDEVLKIFIDIHPVVSQKHLADTAKREFVGKLNHISVTTLLPPQLDVFGNGDVNTFPHVVTRQVLGHDARQFLGHMALGADNVGVFDKLNH